MAISDMAEIAENIVIWLVFPAPHSSKIPFKAFTLIFAFGLITGIDK